MDALRRELDRLESAMTDAERDLVRRMAAQLKREADREMIRRLDRQLVQADA